jgi:multidrug efflux pump subunit AcrB
MGHSLKHADKVHREHREDVVHEDGGQAGPRRDSCSCKGDRAGRTRLLRVLLKARYTTVAVRLAMVIGSMGLIAGGQLEFIFLESDDAETVTIELQMPVGTSLEETDRVTRGSRRRCASRTR